MNGARQSPPLEGAADAGFEAELARLLAKRNGRSPAELFGGSSDKFWLWVNTDGYRSSAALRKQLPGLPSEQVQRQWTGRANDETLTEGFEIYRRVRDLFQRHAGDIRDADGVLDFGCGWGRVIRYFLKDVDHRRLTGTDYNESLVDFCRGSNRWCTFIHNGAEPPLPLEDGSFDRLYAYSVFSHFSEAMHERWLQEFKRIVRPGGALAISVRPRHFIEHCRRLRTEEAETEFSILQTMFPEADDALARYDAGEFTYSAYDSSSPDAWWGEACIPRKYVEREWSGLFEVCEFLDADPQMRQHFVLLRA